MSYGKYLIADLKVEMEVNGEMLRSRSEKYRAEFDSEPDSIIIPAKLEQHSFKIAGNKNIHRG